MAEKQMSEYCSGCKKDLCNGDRIVVARNLKFFHFNCYARKNFFIRLVNPIQTLFIWHEPHVIVDELSNDDSSVAVKKEEIIEAVVPSNRDEINEAIVGGGDTKIEIHELKISKVGDIPKMEDANNQTCDDILDVTANSLEVTEMTNSLVEIIGEVETLKSKIEEFAAEKDHDEQIIIQLEKAIVRHKREIVELKWQNNFLRQESIILHQKLKMYQKAS